ncbi:hypothetical protein J2045_004358 [Peteryoungia aggregata LMG 23059]|uniref:DNA-directed DNA polymerase family A palm domain-containing protein n=1 Tax=Peteryoungia aggregata LMG 23059 TaxID=1368425 RepID=A0ABU0GEZ9_9HYPH|nr:hypothetical protein [Peteryoungia aggregata]MDQ0423306.1 hypothetical protein [Peteryoungia aggregata LMG 23059]
MTDETSALPPSRPFDVNRWSDYPELNNCLTDLVTELERQENRKRQRGTTESKKLREAVRAIVLDLYVAWKTDPDLLVGISLANRSYTTESRYRALFLYWSSFRAAYYLLVQAGYVEEVMAGFHDPRTGVGRNTRIRATPKLIDLLTRKAELNLPRVFTRNHGSEILILRDTCKNPVEYEETASTRDMRETLTRINDHLQRHWIDLRITDEQYRLLQARMKRAYASGTDDSPVIDVSKRTLLRIFNNGSWDEGGRFYGGWWQNIPKTYRRSITIDDKPTVEVDYKTFHPVLLYAQMGAKLEGSAYDLGLPDIPRDLIKVTFNKMVNAPGRIQKPANFPAQRIGMTWHQFQAAIADRHAPIKQFFNSGAGVKLQRLDSELAQNIMLRFIGKGLGYVCLPVHDSFLVQSALADDLKNVMIEEFYNISGHTIQVETIDGTGWDLEQDNHSKPDYINTTITDKQFAAEGDYKGYEQRRLDWLYGMDRWGRPRGLPPTITSAD